ncbi:PHB depolymerase family esterase [Pseudoduganella ginsengisoli]|uniref:PHA-depolymerase-like protein n=1 Tax=Pseudoduganella ginsengisoli TaxID=1462440 RepID=A0A6L6PZ71_9BURK|nr:PHB depolymerase family esterase [Pseudoduganella ginsengisoli]MTW02454.1 hypothetical protein [Pseudoduganella ginsengisoli]
MPRRTLPILMLIILMAIAAYVRLPAHAAAQVEAGASQEQARPWWWPPWVKPPQVKPARLAPMQASGVSVSGLSSGAYMAVQFDVAYSDLVTGAGIIAGGPYDCAQGRLDTATAVCSCTGWLPCHIKRGGTNPPALAAIAAEYEQQGAIAPLANLARHRIWLFSGTGDTVVPTPIVDDLRAWYSRYTPFIAYRNDIHAQHAMPTDNYGNACGELDTPYISNCGFDAAGALLQWIYPGLLPRSTAPATGRMVAFDQSEFLPDPTAHGMALRGYLYVPRDCEASQGQGCRLHIAFHGCLQNAEQVGDQFIRHAGYNAWADSNRLLVLYPQTAAIYPLANPKACWDWFSYDDPAYARRQGRQMAAIKRMADRLTGH